MRRWWRKVRWEPPGFWFTVWLSLAWGLVVSWESAYWLWVWTGLWWMGDWSARLGRRVERWFEVGELLREADAANIRWLIRQGVAVGDAVEAVKALRFGSAVGVR